MAVVAVAVAGDLATGLAAVVVVFFGVADAAVDLAATPKNTEKQSRYPTIKLLAVSLSRSK